MTTRKKNAIDERATTTVLMSHLRDEGVVVVVVVGQRRYASIQTQARM